MSGHSKWSTIKRKKGLIDAERSKIFMRLNKEIYMAAKNGDKDPMNNPTLRVVIDKAKAENMPKDRIQAAIDKAHGANNGIEYENIRYEGYAPGGIAIMIDTLTDNKNRTASDVRSSLTKKGGNLGTDGSVSYLFERKGVFVIPNKYEEETLMNIALENDALDFISNDDSYEIYTTFENFINMKNILEDNKISDFIINEIKYIPTNTIAIEDKEKEEKIYALIDTLEDLDDVQAVYHNMEIKDEEE